VTPASFSQQSTYDAAFLRPGQPIDAGRLGQILFQYQQSTPWLPKLYAEVEMIAFCGTMIDQGWVTVALWHGHTGGFIARDSDEICSLYLAPEACGKGIGTQLLNAAKAASPRLWLRAFEANELARRFYLSKGFRATSRATGCHNEEGLAEVRFEWEHQSRLESAA